MIKAALGILLACIILIGAYTGYQAVEGYLDGKIAIERGKYEQIAEEYKDYKEEAKKRLDQLAIDMIALDEEKTLLLQEVGYKTQEIQTIKNTITDLEETARNLTDINDKLYNANLQIQEYKKVVSELESRFHVCRMTILTQEEMLKRAMAMAKEFEQLYLNEETLKKTIQSRLSLSEKRLVWEKTKFKGSAVLLLAAGGFVLYNEVVNGK